MKKLIFVFVALFVLILISGYNSQKNKTVSFDDNTDSAETVDDTANTDNTENGNADTNAKQENAPLPNKLTVASLDGAFLGTGKNFNVITGSASDNTYAVKINDYQLQRYIPGSGEWNYIASTGYDTLENGWNDYVVKTFDKEGEPIDSLMFSIEYDGSEAPALPDVGASLWITLLATMIASSGLLFVQRRRWL